MVRYQNYLDIYVIGIKPKFFSVRSEIFRPLTRENHAKEVRKMMFFIAATYRARNDCS